MADGSGGHCSTSRPPTGPRRSCAGWRNTMPPHHPKKVARTVSPSLQLLIAALEEADGHDRPGEARALRALAGLAVKQVPTRGVFAPTEADLFTTIEQVAKEHLGLEMPRRVFFAATAQVEDFTDRDAIEAAA